MAMGHNHIQVRALSSGTRMTTLPMPNTRPRCMPHQSAMPLSCLPDTTLYTTRPSNHYPNYTVADHEGSAGTLRTSNASYLPTCPWKAYPLVVLKYSTRHTGVSESPLRHEAVALQWHQQGSWWEFFAPPKFVVIRQSKTNSMHSWLQFPSTTVVSPTKTSPSIGSP